MRQGMTNEIEVAGLVIFLLEQNGSAGHCFAGIRREGKVLSAGLSSAGAAGGLDFFGSFAAGGKEGFLEESPVDVD